MRISLPFLAILSFFSSCRIKNTDHTTKLSIGHYNELDIIYYTNDTLICKTNDTATIDFFSEMISDNNERLSDTCQPSGQLNFENNGQLIFSAVLTTDNSKKNHGCEYISYHFGSKNYRHRLTYRIGMALDGIYWSKVDPVANPSSWRDSTKFRYEQRINPLPNAK
jgi:hypothetical protein